MNALIALRRMIDACGFAREEGAARMTDEARLYERMLPFRRAGERELTVRGLYFHATIDFQAGNVGFRPRIDRLPDRRASTERRETPPNQDRRVCSLTMPADSRRPWFADRVTEYHGRFVTVRVFGVSVADLEADELRAACCWLFDHMDATPLLAGARESNTVRREVG